MPFLIALAVAAVLTPAMRRLGLATGLVDRPAGDALKIHVAPVPVVGGVAVLGAAAVASAVSDWSPPAEVLAAAAVALLAGLLDDVRPLPASARLVLQAGAGAVLLASPLRLAPFGALEAVALLALVVACANAVNLVDGQDALAGGVAAIAALGLAAMAALDSHRVATDLGLAVAGSLGGFLLWNRPPAAVFLGNGGAYAVGALLAALTALVVAGGGVRTLLGAALCLGVFAFELGFTVARRLLSGERVVAGDRLHSYDLVARRVGRAATTLIFWGLGLLGALVGLAARSVPPIAATILTACVLAAACAAGLRLWSGRVPAPAPTESTKENA